MKKIIITLAAIVLSAAASFAQDMATATETAKMANESLIAGNKSAALSGFQEALGLAAACGADGEELANTCKGQIPVIMLSIAKDCLKNSDYTTAVTKLEESVAKAKEFGVADVVEEATSLIPQAFMAQGGKLLQGKDFAGAVTAFQKVLELNPTDGMAALRLGSALAGAGKVDDAVKAFEQAIENGQADNAKKQLSNLFLKKAAAALKTKNYAAAVEGAVKANEYLANAQALLVAGQASQQLNKSADAIGYFEQYLEASPKAKNSNTIAFTVAALYQKAGNKAKAIEFYNKVTGDPVLGVQAKQQIDALNK